MARTKAKIDTTSTPFAVDATFIELLPEQILIDEGLNVRPYTDASDPGEMDSVQQLAGSIEKEGQLHPILVRSIPNNGVAEYHLIAGKRRKSAIELLNAAKAKGEEPLQVQCKVEWGVDDSKARRQALVENIHRRNLSPMDLAVNIRNLRQEMGEGRQGTNKIKDYLQVSAAQVTQHEKLLTLSPEHQALLGGVSPKLSAQAGFDLLDVHPEKRDAVLGIARARQKDEAAETEAVEAVDIPDIPIKRKHVLAAARETEGALQKQKPRTRSEIVEFFDSLDSIAYGYEDGAVRQFLNYLVNTWCSGGGSDRTLMAKFDAMTEKAPKGTRPTEGKARPQKTKSTAKKTARQKK